jgi:hypothetical protein
MGATKTAKKEESRPQNELYREINGQRVYAHQMKDKDLLQWRIDLLDAKLKWGNKSFASNVMRQRIDEHLEKLYAYLDQVFPDWRKKVSGEIKGV